MGLLSLLGMGKAAVEPIEAVGNILDGLFTSDEERLDKKIVLERLAQNKSLAQVELNKLEASHASLFVAGWRPAVGWTCAFALAWHFFGYDMLSWVQAVFWPDTPKLPALNGTETLVTVLMSLLGLGGLRTYEKLNKVARSQ